MDMPILLYQFQNQILQVNSEGKIQITLRKNSIQLVTSYEKMIHGERK